MSAKPRISPFLWFEHQAEEAANFYVSIFPNSRITQLSRYGEAGREHHRREPGSVMVVAFELDGQPVAALNGGPLFRFSEAISLVISCETQEEVDHYWDRLSEGGDPKAQACGWLKDRYGLSWQVVPTIFSRLFGGQPNEGSERAMATMMQMKKPDIAALQAAYEGVAV